MRIIKRSRIRQWAQTHPDAAHALEAWHEVARQARWRSLTDLRRDFPAADGVSVASGRIATVFNLRGGNYRMITAIHYNTGVVFMLRFLTHREYDTNKWKRQL